MRHRVGRVDVLDVRHLDAGILLDLLEAVIRGRVPGEVVDADEAAVGMRRESVGQAWQPRLVQVALVVDMKQQRQLQLAVCQRSPGCRDRRLDR